jgi:hypothetical protein
MLKFLANLQVILNQSISVWLGGNYRNVMEHTLKHYARWIFSPLREMSPFASRVLVPITPKRNNQNIARLDRVS